MVGRRGRILLFFGVLDIVYGLSLWRPGDAGSTPFYVWLDQVAPLGLWAMVWAIVGVVCVVQAFFRTDRFGFAAAIGLYVLWGGIALGGWAWGPVDRGWVSAAIWLGLAYTVSVIAGWPEVPGGRVPWRWTRQRSLR